MNHEREPRRYRNRDYDRAPYRDSNSERLDESYPRRFDSEGRYGRASTYDDEREARWRYGRHYGPSINRHSNEEDDYLNARDMMDHYEPRYPDYGRGYDRSSANRRDLYSRRGEFGRRYESDYRSEHPYRERGWWDRFSDEVASWFGDEEADRRRWRDEIQAGQYRGVGPRDYRRSDERIREDVNDRLTDHPNLDASAIQVTVKEREVILTGSVSSRSGKRTAEEVAESVSGVVNVQNNLRVNRLATAEPPQIAGQAKANAKSA